MSSMSTRKVMWWAAVLVASIWSQDVAASRPVAGAPAAQATGAPGTSAGGWREWRGEGSNSGQSRGPTPALKGEKWRYIADGEIVNSPAVADGVVYFGARTGTFHAVDAKSGRKVWLQRCMPLSTNGNQKGFSYSAPLVFGDRVIVGGDDGFLYCLARADGKELWKLGLDDLSEVWSSPKTNGKLVMVGTKSGFLWGIDPIAGVQRWKANVGDAIGGSLAIVGATQGVIPARDKRLHAIDLEKGTVLWRCDLPNFSMGAPSLALGYAFFQARGGHFLAVDLLSQKVAWDFAEMPSGSYFQPAPSCDGNRVYVTNGATVLSFDCQSGEKAWAWRGTQPFDCSCTIVGDYVIIAGNDQALTALDKNTGAVVKQIPLGEKVLSSPCVVDGVVYVTGSSGTLFAIE